jgi:cytosine/adenosine deaminase-related metal-dependent hydrolase
MRMFFRARWILPIDRPPLRDGWLEVSGDVIVGLGAGPPPALAHDLGVVAVLPGLVNVHTHLELSWMAGRIPPSASMDDWIQQMLRLRGEGPSPGQAERAARGAIADAKAAGTALVGDISNGLTTPSFLADARLQGVVFHELIGFDVVDPAPVIREAKGKLDRALQSVGAGAGVRGGLVAHAPYSVSPALFRAIAETEGDVPLAVHVGESVEEMEFLRTGGGPMRRTLEALGRWRDDWAAPGSDPVEYLRRVGYLQPGMLAVHATHLDRRSLESLRDAGAVVVTCPRSNVWVGAGVPRVSQFYASGVPVAIGTDSLASVPTLNLFDELAALRRIAPDVSASAMLESATRVGAEALGFGRTHGTLAPGKHASLVAVEVPGDVTDVEEYLVSGVAASAIRSLT